MRFANREMSHPANVTLQETGLAEVATALILAKVTWAVASASPANTYKEW